MPDFQLIIDDEDETFSALVPSVSLTLLKSTFSPVNSMVAPLISLPRSVATLLTDTDEEAASNIAMY